MANQSQLAAKPALDILSEMTASLASDHDLEAVLARFLEPIVTLARASAGAVRVKRDDGRGLRLAGSVGLPADVLRCERMVSLDCGVCGAAMADGTIHIASDLALCAGRTQSDYFGEHCKRIMAIPLYSKGEMLGIYNLFFAHDQELAPQVVAVLRSIGDVLGLALENARLTRENLRATVLHERQAMANEVHDSLAQNLSYVKMRLPLLREAVLVHNEPQAIKFLGDVEEAISGAYSNLREILAHFRRRMDPRGLVHALEVLAKGFHDKTEIRLEFANFAPDVNLSIEQELQVLHIVEEALANVAKHSLARHARVTLGRKMGGYEILIEDDGLGMAAKREATTGASEAASVQTGSFGLEIMRERAQALGGRLDFESVPGTGSRVRLRFPDLSLSAGSRP